MKIRNLILATAALGFMATPVIADHHMAKAIKVNKELKILTNAKGMALYTFDKDKAGVSNCKGKCAEKWPPFMATAKSKNEGAFSVLTRADGSKQWAHKGMALYTWFKDKKAGDVTGDGVKGVWHVAKP